MKPPPSSFKLIVRAFNKRSKFRACVAIICALAGTGWAQVTTADIVGTVSDGTVAIVPNASVTLTNTETSIVHRATPSGTGDYVFTLLPLGKYSIRIDATGFKVFEISSVSVLAGDRVRVNGSMEIGETSETVTVEAITTALQTDNSTMITGLCEKSVQDLPLNGRNFINLAQVAAGANEGPTNSLTSGSRPDDRRATSAISVNGQSDVINNQLIDGMDNNERIIGTIGVRPSIDAISEVRIQTNNYSAEVGRAAGGVVNIITKSGTDKFHGTLYAFFRNDKLNATPFQFGAHNRNPELRQNQFGGSFGLPIKRGNTFFFGDYETFRLVQGTPPTSLTVPTAYEVANPGDFTDIGGPLITAPDPAGLAYFKLYPLPTLEQISTLEARTKRSSPTRGSPHVCESDFYCAKLVCAQCVESEACLSKFNRLSWQH